ncbi:MAG TPA: FIST N-terminal domain-containing protein [Thermoanaerobaculia bacterium]|nr:FIST N-terminal domain-containing protein [Thermoanaerobaculia bacterium]
MRSRTVSLPSGPCPEGTLRAAATAEGRDPDLVLGFLPPDEQLPGTLRTLAATWPESLRFGCEADTQFADAAVTRSGSLQLFWFELPGHGATVEVVCGTRDEPPDEAAVAALARGLAQAGGALLLADGVRFPAEDLLGRLAPCFSRPLPRLAGGLASQRDPRTSEGGRVFYQDEVLPAACLALTFRGVSLRIKVVRGWDPASPVYTVTRAAGTALYEINGEPAVDWYARFFTVDGTLAPLPETAFRFPLILEGPAAERQGVYRTMRSFDDPKGAVTFWGSLHTGDRVRLGMGNQVSLVRTAADLSPGTPPDAAILYSCIGREAVLGTMAGDELAAIQGALGGASLSGFFTNGEIGPSDRGGLAFYNQTAILVLLRELPEIPELPKRSPEPRL